MTARINQLGYLGFGVSDPAAWEPFMTKVLGLQKTREASDGSSAYRMDSRVHRFLVHPDPADDLIFMGWEAADREAVNEAAKAVEAAGFEVQEGSAQDREDRGVQDLIKFQDPAGTPVEIFHGLPEAGTPFQSECVGSKFVADDFGLGHLVVSTRSRDESRDFYMNVLGFKFSDYITCDIGGYHVDIAFMHTNPRHHSLAVGGKMPKRIHHFMLQVAAMDDVGLAYDRARDHKVNIVQELGRHPNDRMFSFYAQTPSGFEFEFGWGGREIDDGTWEPTTYHQVSEWGHRRPPRRKKA